MNSAGRRKHARKILAHAQNKDGTWRINPRMKPENQDRTRSCITQSVLQSWPKGRIIDYLKHGPRALPAWEGFLETERQLNELRRRNS